MIHIAAFDESIFPQKTMKTECGKRVGFDKTLSPANGHRSDCKDCVEAWYSRKHGLAAIAAYSNGHDFSDLKSKELVTSVVGK